MTTSLSYEIQLIPSVFYTFANRRKRIESKRYNL